MNKDMELNSKIRQHKILDMPILGAIILAIYGLAFYQIFATLGGESKVLSFLLGTLGGVLLLVIHKQWFKGEYKGSVSLDFLKDKSYLIVFGVFVVMDAVVAVLAYSQVGLIALTLEGLTQAIMAAIAEEAALRVLPCSVIMRSYKEKNNYMVALLFSAIFFGVIHFANILTGAGISNTLIQVASAFSGGLIMGALYLRTGSIIPCIVIHLIHDILTRMVGTGECGAGFDTFLNSLIIITNVVLAVILLKGKKEEIIETWNNIWISQTEQKRME